MGQATDGCLLDPGPNEAFQQYSGIPATEGRAPITPETGERGNCFLVTDPCLIPGARDGGSGHLASNPEDRVHRSVPLRADNKAPVS